MKTQPIRPALIEFDDAHGHQPQEPPFAPDFGDRYHPRIGAQAQARHVFLQGNGLPRRWAGRDHFVVLETGFGLGHNFLATWHAWRQDDQRCSRLHFVSVERHPPRAGDLARAHAHAVAQAPTDPLFAELATSLLRAWPSLTANLHLLDFDDARVQLTLALGDARLLLPALRLSADAIYLDGFAPARNPQMWTPQLMKAVARLAAPGATAATWSVARELHAGLKTAGFEVSTAPGTGGKRENTRARWVPSFVPRRLPDPARSAPEALVVGAGLAGAAVAQALARQGLRVTVFEQSGAAASGASGNAAGLFHGTVNPDDGPYARLYRAAALAASAEYRLALAGGHVSGQAQGLLRVAAHEDGARGLQGVLQALGLPADYVQALDRADASRRAGVPLPADCWYYPGGGWLSPGDWVRHALRTPGVTLRTDCPVHRLHRLHRDQGGWALLGPQGQVWQQGAVVVLCNAGGAAELLHPMGLGGWPLRPSRGQITQWRSPPAESGRMTPAAALQLPVAGDGYALPLPDGVLCGATRQDDDLDPTLRTADHQHNLERLQRLTGLHSPVNTSDLLGRVGWRWHADDRLPIAGAVPAAAMPAGQRLDQARLLPREPGLFVLTALGARGLTLAPLLGRLVAAQVTGTPWPLEQDLVDAVDPGRWIVRAARRGSELPAQPSGNQAG